jgi:cell division protein FtsZ
MLNFDLPKNQSSIIKVIGVGGGGSNAVTHMFHQGIKGVDFIICNTDAQAMEASPVPTKIQLGATLTSGLGAGAVPSVGKNAALENKEEIKSILEKNTKMLFITAGLGGGTGTGAAPVIACVARELGILTVAIVTIPFSFEGRKRKQHAEEGIAELKRHVDALLIIKNDKLRELYGNLTLRAAFGHADDVLTTAAKGIAELITVTGYINVDFEDVKTVMKDSGVAIMGVGIASGENRAALAIEQAMCSPLLNDDNVEGANNILLYIISGKEEIKMDEVTEITEYIQTKTKSYTEVIWGNGIDESLEDNISVTVIATGFDDEHRNITKPEIKPARIIHSLDGKANTVIEEPKTILPDVPVFNNKPKPMEQPVIEIKAKQFPEPANESQIKPAEEPAFESTDSLDEEPVIEPEPVIFSFTMNPPEITPEENETLVEESYITEPSDETSAISNRMLVFEIDQQEQKIPESIVDSFEEETDSVISPVEYSYSETQPVPEVQESTYVTTVQEPLADQDRIQQDRKEKLKTLSEKLKIHVQKASLETDLYEIESVPAYKRRNVDLADIPPSSQSQASKYSVQGDTDDNSNPINENPYLHNKPD